MATHTVATDRGPLTVKSRINAHGLVTGRVGGKTYMATTWAEVEQAIREDYRGYPPMAKYLAVFFVRVSCEEGQVYETDELEHIDGLALSHTTIEISDPCGEPGTPGRWVLHKGKTKPVFHHCQENEPLSSVVLGNFGYEPRIVLWTADLESALDDVIDRIRVLTRSLDSLLATEALPALGDAMADARRTRSFMWTPSLEMGSTHRVIDPPIAIPASAKPPAARSPQRKDHDEGR